MFYVIGVDHKREQYPHSMNDKEKVERLQKTMRQLCQSKKIQLIAEEWCDDARSYWSVNRTYSEDIAIELAIEHLSCDPGQAERDKLQMRSREQIAQDLGINFVFIQENSDEEHRVNEAAKKIDEKRERYWLEKIIGRVGTNKNTLLVCGFGHSDSFIALAKSNGYEAEKIIIR
jgi:hypothetical protein